MKYKEFEVQLKESGEETPRITAYASTFDREPDSYGDVVAKGAFADSLKKWDESGMRIPLLYGHRTDDPMMNLGGVVEAKEDEIGLLITAEFDMDNPNAVKARRDVIAKTLCKMSFAYDVLDEVPVELEGGIKANELRKLEIYEVSLVPIPANQHAVVVDVKAATAEAEADEKAGRRNSAADESTLERIGELADEIKDEVSGLIGADDDTEEAEEPQEAKEQSEEPNEANADTEEKAADAAEIEDADASATSEKEKEMEKSILAEIGEQTDAIVDAPAKTLGEHAVKAAKSIERGQRFSVVTDGFKAAGDTITVGNIAATTTVENAIYGARQQMQVANLFGQESISGNALTYYVEGAVAGDFAVVAEDGQKPGITPAFTEKTVNLAKIAGVLRESDEIVNDAAWLASAINNRGVYMLGLKEEAKLIADLIATSGVQTGTALTFDGIHTAITNVQVQTGMAADAIIMNPADWNTLALTKETATSAVYVLGGPAQMSAKMLWGVPVVTSSQIAAGKAIVGAFKQGAAKVTNGGVQVEMSNSDGSDFSHNRVAIRIEERLALAVRVPAAFVVITQAS